MMLNILPGSYLVPFVYYWFNHYSWYWVIFHVACEYWLPMAISRTTLAAHACNPSYSGGRDQGDHSSKPSQANSLWDPSWKNTHMTKGLVEWLKV
jgi:hypothetical protein